MNWKVIKEVGFPIAVAVFLVQGFMGLLKYLVKERSETTQGEIQETQNDVKELVKSNQEMGQRIAQANADLGQKITESNHELAERLASAIMESSQKNSEAVMEMARAVGRLEGQGFKPKEGDDDGGHNKKLQQT